LCAGRPAGRVAAPAFDVIVSPQRVPGQVANDQLLDTNQRNSRCHLNFRRASTRHAVAPPSFVIARPVQLDYNAFTVPDCLPKPFTAFARGGKVRL
jgi:hypothetical protein